MSTVKFVGLRALVVVIMAYGMGFIGGAIPTMKLFQEHQQWSWVVMLATAIAGVVLGALTYRATILDIEAEIREWQRDID